MLKILKIIISIMLMVSFIGCKSNLSADAYQAVKVGEVVKVKKGIVIDVTLVNIASVDKVSDGGLGLIVGTIAGGVLGSTIGGGDGKAIATVAGALAGGATGGVFEKKLGQQVGYRYVIQLDNGDTISIVQGKQNPISVGARVLLLDAGRERARVIRDTSFKR